MTNMPSQWPESVRATLATLCTELEPIGRCSVSVFGSLAQGTWRPSSDVNVAIVGERFDGAALRALGPILARAQSSRVSPILFERRELSALAVVFAVKVAHIKSHHVVILGDDPFSGLTIDRTHLRSRIEQELCNQLVRLRRTICRVAGDDGLAARVVLAAATPLLVELESVLVFLGEPPPPDRASIAALAAKRLDLDGDLLSTLARRTELTTPPHALLDQLLTTLERVVAFVRAQS